MCTVPMAPAGSPHTELGGQKRKRDHGVNALVGFKPGPFVQGELKLPTALEDQGHQSQISRSSLR